MSVRDIIMAAAGAQTTSGYRYWRIYINSNNGDSWVTLAEVELRATIGGADLTTPSTPMQASNDAIGSVYNLIDNNDMTYWMPSMGLIAGQWARFDLGSPTAVAQVALKARPGNAAQAPQSFDIQRSNNGTSFTTVKSFTGVTSWTSAFLTFDL